MVCVPVGKRLCGIEVNYLLYWPIEGATKVVVEEEEEEKVLLLIVVSTFLDLKNKK